MVRRGGCREDMLANARKEAQLFPRLPGHLRDRLAAIPATPNGYPCLATLTDGSERDWVYVAEAFPWFESWGVWPEDDDAKHALSLDDVADLRESPSRLPPHISQTLYDAGESGMGYVLFTLRFRDGSEQAFGAGNAVDFPDLPAGKRAADIVSVTPHAGRDSADRRSVRPYLWCLYSAIEDAGGR